MKTLCKLYKYGYLILAMAACLMLASCGKESLDYNHPDVDLFVKQLKTGKYSTQSPEGLSNVPKFAKEDIEELLKYAEDLTVIPSFSVSSRILFGRRKTAVRRMYLVDGGNDSFGT